MDEYQHLASRAANGGSAEDWYRLGCWLADRRFWGSAAGCFARSGGDYRALTNWGWALHQVGRSEEALLWLTRAVEAKPDEGTPHALLSQVWGTFGQGGLAKEYGLRAVEADPGAAINHVALSFALMSAGQWREGWAEYEHRFAYKLPEFLTRPWPLWRGERVGHLYLECEQGTGDSMFAARWFPACFERADKTTIYCQKELYALFDCNFTRAGVTIRPMPRTLPTDVDAWCPAMSIPAALGIGGPDEKTAAPYLHG